MSQKYKSFKTDSEGEVSGELHGNYWIIRIGKTKPIRCVVTQTIHLQMDAEEWDIQDVAESIHRLLLEKEKQKA